MQILFRSLEFTGHLVLVVCLLTGVAGRGAIPSLSTPAYTTGRFSGTLHGESNATYIVLASTNLSDWTPVATNQDAAESRTVDFSVSHDRAFIKVQTIPVSGLAFAFAANGQIIIKERVDTDSFNSEDPALSTRGRYDPTKSRDHGDVAAQEQVVVATTNHVKIRGRVFTGPGGTVNFTNNAAAGSTNWTNAGRTGIEPGWFADNMNAAFGSVGVPFTSGYMTPSSGAYLGTNYTYLIGTDKYQLASINLASTKTMMVVGNAQLYVSSNFWMSGQSRIIIAPGASLKLYVGGMADFSGQGIFNQTGKARNCFIYGLPGCSQVRFTGNSEFIGVVYAPTAELQLGSGGFDILDIQGASIAGSITINAINGIQFHYDESLLGWAGPPGITLQPPDQTALSGSDVTFSVLATGKTPLSYQWQKSGTNLNQTNATLTLSSVQFSDAGSYRVWVTNGEGWVTSRWATLTVVGPPAITQQPENQTVFVGETVTFAVWGLGTAPLYFQWRKDDGDLAGQINSTLVIPNAQLTDSGSYSVVVGNTFGWATSQVASLTVQLMAPAIFTPAR